MKSCACECHLGKMQKQHIIPCCSKASLSTRFTESSMRKLVESSIDDAIATKKLDDEALRQKFLQRNVEEKLKASTHSGDSKKNDLEEDDPMNTGAPKRAQPTGVPAAPQITQPAQAPQQAAPQVIDPDAIIDKLNIIRSGKSLNDKDIRDAAKSFLAAMGPQQLKALFGVLQQMGQIVQPAVPPRVQAPPEEPSAVRDARLQMLQQKSNETPTPAAAAPQPAPQQTVQQPQRKREKREEEDITPPIRVGARTSEATKRDMKLLLQE